jgi:hypothetical protein
MGREWPSGDSAIACWECRHSIAAEMDGERALSKPSSDAIVGDIACFHCGYNLRTFEADGGCPECGNWIAASLPAPRASSCRAIQPSAANDLCLRLDRAAQSRLTKFVRWRRSETACGHFPIGHAINRDPYYSPSSSSSALMATFLRAAGGLRLAPCRRRMARQKSCSATSSEVAFMNSARAALNSSL